MIIGLGHRKQAGKSTVGKVLERYGFQHRSFADPLYKGCARLVEWKGEVTTPEGKQTFKDAVHWVDVLGAHCNGREVLEIVGTDIVRGIDPRTWIALEDYDLRTTADPGAHYYYDDLRFPNEAEWIKSRGGVLVHVYRPSLGFPPDDAHESEVALLDFQGWDYELCNSGSLGDLHCLAEILAETTLVRHTQGIGG